METSTLIYNAAKAALDTHITLDNNVPGDVGCAEAVSFVLNKAQVVGIPAEGFEGTAGLYDFLKTNFDPIASGSERMGDVIISPTGTSTKGTPHGHTGIVGEEGILSNDSDTGLFMEKYTVASWQTYFGAALGFPVFYFRSR